MKGMRVYKAGDLTALRQVISGSTTDGFWLRHRKDRPQVVGVDHCQLLKRRAIWKVKRRKKLHLPEIKADCKLI